MTAMKKERDILLLKLKAKTSPKLIPDSCQMLTMTELMDVLENVYKSGRHYALFSANGLVPTPGNMNLKTITDVAGAPITDNIVFISDFWRNKDKTEYRLLIKRGNPDAANPSFTNIEKNTTRSVSPGAGETNGQSSHLIISLDTTHKSINGFRATLEVIVGISRSLVMPYLNGLIYEATKTDPRFSYEKTVKKEKTEIRYRPAIGHTSSPSSSLKSDLKKGYLSSVEFIDNKVTGATGPDTDPAIKHVSKRLHFHLKPVENYERAQELIRKLNKKARESDFDYIRVSMRNNEQEKYVSTRFKTEEGDALDKLYSKAETVKDFKHDLKSCYDKVHGELADAMMQLITTTNKW